MHQSEKSKIRQRILLIVFIVLLVAVTAAVTAVLVSGRNRTGAAEAETAEQQPVETEQEALPETGQETTEEMQETPAQTGEASETSEAADATEAEESTDASEAAEQNAEADSAENAEPEEKTEQQMEQEETAAEQPDGAVLTETKETAEVTVEVGTEEISEADEETAAAAQTRPIAYTITLAGDCTLGGEGNNGGFMQKVGTDYTWPFSNVAAYFKNDDLTFVNLEGVLSMDGYKTDKEYVFHAPSEYTQCLTEGGIEAVTLANNHAYDYGTAGYDGTKAALEQYGVSYVEDKSTLLYTTENGLKVGIYTESFPTKTDNTLAGITALKEQGAEIIICAYHWGTERKYTPDKIEVTVAHAAVDAGASIVYGAHPHVLQPVENYNGAVIFYSLANFCFGGNRHPYDLQTAFAQITVVRETDGTVRLGPVTVVPCCGSTNTAQNDYCPTPYEEGSDEYLEVMSKLDGTYAGMDDGGDYGVKAVATPGAITGRASSAPAAKTEEETAVTATE